MKHLNGSTALVTGASSGIGAEFAKQLAGKQCNLVLVARRADRLEALRDELVARHGIAVTIVAMDLALPEAPMTLFEQTERAGIQIDILVNNAGFGLFGDFDRLDFVREQEMIQLNIVTLVDLTKRYVAGMKARNYGHIIQVASTTAYQPTPLYATYGATKSFVLSYGEALNFELRDSQVNCTVVSPGITRTEFFEVSGQKFTLFHRLTIKDASEVVDIALKRMHRGGSVVTGGFNALLTFSVRFVPRKLAAMIGYLFMRNPS